MSATQRMIRKMGKIAKKIIRIARRYSKITFYSSKLKWSWFQIRFYKLIKLNRKLDLNDDRRFEVMSFCKISEETLDRLLEEVKESAQSNNKTVLDLSDDKELLNRYIGGAERQAVSHMLRYTRYDKSMELLYYFNQKYKNNNRKQIKVLDYGCGVADYALSFGVYGYYITLSDIEGGAVEFAKWRCKKRNLKYDFIPVNASNMYPEFGQQDIIIAGEVLEHIREPLRTVRAFYNALPSGGYLWVSDYPYREKRIGGGHLKEAFDARESVLRFLNNNFRKIPIGEGHLLWKIDTCKKD
jgi:2-polyprenyl-3-methyl-5-hydroxy-6-metoxy-1,4-benzoquinol methylase